MWVYLFIKNISDESQLYSSKKIIRISLFGDLSLIGDTLKHKKYYFVILELPFPGLGKMHTRNISILHAEPF